MGIYDRIGGLLPTRLLSKVRSELYYVGIDVDERRFSGFLVLFSLGIATALALNLYLFLQLPVIASFFLVFAIVCGGVYFWIDQTAESGGKRAERVLPDVLELVASNIKAGLTTERALFTAARPEFGIISVELKAASRRILSGERLDDALLELTKKIKSRVLERTMWLLVQGIKSGGQIADLLIQLGSDLREENAMKDEIAANISMYVMLIFFAAAFGAPLLFGISSVIVGVMGEQTGTLTISPEQIESYSQMSQVGRFFGVPTTSVTEGFVTLYSVIALFVTCVFASFTIGAISAGSEKQGVKFVPIILFIALALFYVSRMVLGELLGGISGMM